MTGRHILAIVGAILGFGSLTIYTQCNPVITVTVSDVKSAIPPENRHFGWAGPEAVKASEHLVKTLPPFKIKGVMGDNSKANVRLWDLVKFSTGKHIWAFRQETGDCVGNGAATAVDYALFGETGKFRKAHPSYIYGTSRVDVGQGRIGCRSAGSVGAWAAEAVKTRGVLFIDDEGAPEYSGRLSDSWGCRGPPEELRRIAETRRVRTTALVTTPEEVRDAICNGYPVTVASSWGTERYFIADNRWVARGDGRWPHEMCLCAYDGSASEPYWYVQNSWGPDPNREPLQGEPPGGFWIRRRDVERMLSERDSFAFSGFEGFPSQDIDFNVFRSEQ